ncbi:MAG: helix-turn-helix transcriptional regulator [Treponema sp.]|nr:helix-turn-helix transcriptional regulator [Treponema sp.]
MEDKPRIRTIIANNIRKYRKLNKLTQEVLAERADVSNTYIANIECGQTWLSDKTLEKIAAALQIEIYLLFIPDSEEKTCVEDEKRKFEQTVSFLSEREEELCSYVKNFFAETFLQIQKI